jgi:uncharacterized membrane protein
MAKNSRLLLILCAVLALGASVAALYVHYRLIADPTYQSFCDVTETVSCEAVYRSAYGTVAGVPVAAGGAIWSALVLILAAYGLRVPSTPAASRSAGYIFILSIVGLAATFYYGYASFVVLQKTCPLCVAVYVASIGIFAVSAMGSHAGFGVLSGLGRDVAGLLGSSSAAALGTGWLVASLALVGFFPKEPIADVGSATTAGAQQAAAPVEALDPAALADWHKWLDSQPTPAETLRPTGALKVRIVKFNDYQCPACKATYVAYHDIFTRYQQSHPGVFAYETHDFPLESECGFGGIHASACEAAVAVRLAKAKNKGPELEAWLFQRQETMTRDMVKQGLAEVAQVTDFDAQYTKVLDDVRADARLGQQLGVQGTPTFFLNGMRIGNLRPAYLDAAIAYLLSKS